MTLRTAALAVILALSAIRPAAAEEIVVFAAASLKTALDRIAADWGAETGNVVLVSYGGSSALAKQIAAGAPADLFLSASVEWMDVLDADGLILPGSRRDLLGNSLVLVAQGRDAPAVTIGPGFDLAGMLGDGRLAMALVDSVPAGQYGREALQSLGVWDSVKDRLAEAENVRAALALVAMGETPFGIVYTSDAVAAAAAAEAVTAVGTFPADSHRPIVYPVALVAGAKPEARELLDELSGERAGAVFLAEGFTLIGR